MLHIYAAVAEQERTKISERTKAALAAARAAKLSQNEGIPFDPKVRLFDHLVPTGEHLSAMVIRAARLAAILLHIARDRRPAKDPARR